MGKCIFEDVCDKSWCRLYSFECVDGQNYKPADKIEPKFKVGDWITNSTTNPAQISSIKDGIYFTHNDTIGGDVESIDKEYHLWTIQDAKDGEILATQDYIFIFEKLLPEDGGVSYCHYDFGSSTPQFDFNKDENWYFGKEAKVYPATKEQRDLLFKEMKEAGYEWSEETHELKEINNEEINGEDYGIDSLWHAQRILEKTLGEVEGYQSDDGILEHKCAISAVKKLYTQKPVEWSKEDDSHIYSITEKLKGKFEKSIVITRFTLEEDLSWLKSLKNRVLPKQEWSDEDKELMKWSINNLTELKDRFGEEYGKVGDCINWLKSLRHKVRWKPSDNELEVLRLAAEKDGTCLMGLYEQLKKLK